MDQRERNRQFEFTLPQADRTPPTMRQKASKRYFGVVSIVSAGIALMLP
jgi:hypothetical protein